MRGGRTVASTRSFAFLIKRLWSNIRPVRPGYCTTFDFRLPEEFKILERSEHGAPLQIFRKINYTASTIIEDNPESII